MMKKMMAMFLALTMSVCLGTTVFAVSPPDSQPTSVIVEDTDFVRVVAETSEDGTTYVEYDKLTGGFTFTYPNGNKVIIEGNAAQHNADDGVSVWASVQAEEHTFANYEYIKYRGGTWELRRPDNGPLSYYYFEIDSAAANDDDLDDLLENFQGKVEALNTAEIAFIGSVAKATREVVLALGIGSVPAPGTKVTAATILKAAGIEAGVAFTAGVVVFEACEAAYDVYFDIFDNYQDYVL